MILSKSRPLLQACPRTAWCDPSSRSDAGRAMPSVGRGPLDTGRGFTLLEVLIVLGIVAVLAAIATPQFARLIASWRIASNVETLAMAVDFARAEAIGRNTMVQICRTTTPAAASPTCSTAEADGVPGDDWATGWIVYARPQAAATPAAFTAGTDELLRRFEATAATGTVRAIVKTNTGEAAMAFTGNALRRGGEGNDRMFILDYRDASTSTLSPVARCLRVSMVGKVRTGVPSGGGCDVS